MKKLSAIIVALALYFSASAFNSSPAADAVNPYPFNAADSRVVKAENVTATVSKAFKEKFAAAEQVYWKENQGIYFAEFVLNQQQLSAAYANDGEMIAVSRRLTTEQLPLAVTESLKEQYGDYALPATVTEIVMQGATNYYLIAEGKTRKLQLKCSPDGNISVDKKIKKKILVGSVE